MYSKHCRCLARDSKMIEFVAGKCGRVENIVKKEKMLTTGIFFFFQNVCKAFPYIKPCDCLEEKLKP